MKKIIVFLLFSVILLTGCRGNTLKYISNEVNTDLKNCKIISEIDTHGGFLGDGELFVKMDCSNNEISQKPINWKELPLSLELDKAVTMLMCNSDGCSDIFDKYNIPRDMQGYYFFYDRHSESIDRYNDLELNNRASYNYSFALYDNSTKILYFYELDT